jgi:hypothetical protein
MLILFVSLQITNIKLLMVHLCHFFMVGAVGIHNIAPYPILVEPSHLPTRQHTRFDFQCPIQAE